VRHELLKRSQFLEDYRGIVLEIAAANVLAADRFCDTVETALDLLISHPEAGPRAGFLKAPDVRFWPLRHFPNYLLFYRVAGKSVIVLRLLYGARNLPVLIPAE
jgi:toxin ParE1/3/4